MTPSAVKGHGLTKMNQLATGLGLLIITVLGGCSPYQMQGVVIEGTNPGIEIVDRHDLRLEQVGVPSVEIEVRLDPDRFNPELIGRGQSDRDGRFAVPISEPGAGFLILDVRLIATRERYLTQTERFDLPGSGKRVLITMQGGKDRKTLEDPDILDRTLKDAEPYLRQRED